MENKLRNLDQEFLKYCQKNDLKKVEACLSLEVDVNTVFEGGWWCGLTVAADGVHQYQYQDLISLFLFLDLSEV